MNKALDYKKLKIESMNSIVNSIIDDLVEKIFNQQYFPTYEQIIYESEERFGVATSKIREFIANLKLSGLIFSYHKDRGIERLFPFPNTTILGRKIKKIKLSIEQKDS